MCLQRASQSRSMAPSPHPWHSTSSSLTHGKIETRTATLARTSYKKTEQGVNRTIAKHDRIELTTSAGGTRKKGDRTVGGRSACRPSQPACDAEESADSSLDLRAQELP